MKKILLMLILFKPFICYSQFGKKLDFIEKDGIRISKGDTLMLGEGAGLNGEFLHVTFRIDNSRVGNQWANKMVLVEKITESKFGINTIFYITVRATEISRFIINDISLAIKKREVVSVNSKNL